MSDNSKSISDSPTEFKTFLSEFQTLPSEFQTFPIQPHRGFLFKIKLKISIEYKKQFLIPNMIEKNKNLVLVVNEKPYWHYSIRKHQ